jgi:hypothetical protein
MLKLTLKQLRHVSVQSHHAVTAVKVAKKEKKHQCVVMWPHMLLGPCWCVYVALFGSRLLLVSKKPA